MVNEKRALLPFYKNFRKRFSGRGLKKYSFIQKIDNYTQSKLKSNFSIVDGQKMYLDAKDNLSLSVFGIYEPLETNLVKKEIKKRKFSNRYWSIYRILHINFFKTCWVTR